MTDLVTAIKDTMLLANQTYRAGYEEGLREGKRLAHLEFLRLIESKTPPKQENAA